SISTPALISFSSFLLCSLFLGFCGARRASQSEIVAFSFLVGRTSFFPVWRLLASSSYRFLLLSHLPCAPLPSFVCLVCAVTQTSCKSSRRFKPEHCTVLRPASTEGGREE